MQMKPSNAISKLGRPSSRRNASQLSLSNNITCPEGTVIIKRAQKEDLLMAKVSTSFAIKFESKGSYQLDQLPAGHQVATLVLPAKNIGIHAVLNVWEPDVEDDQFSSSNVFVASPDGSVANGIAGAWAVNPTLYPNQLQSTQLFVYWTKDSGKSTGCFNILCPGFVQVSQKTPVGTKLEPVSYYNSEELQYDFLLAIVQTLIKKMLCNRTQGLSYKHPTMSELRAMDSVRKLTHTNVAFSAHLWGHIWILIARKNIRLQML